MICCGNRGSSEHVGSPWTHRCCAGKCCTATLHTSKGRRFMHHRLLIARLVIRHQGWVFNRELLERLTNTSNISMPEDSKDTLNGAFAVIAIDCVLMRKEFNNCLANCHFACGHIKSFLRCRRAILGRFAVIAKSHESMLGRDDLLHSKRDLGQVLPSH